MKRILPDCVSEAYVVVNGRDGTWHLVNGSGVSRLKNTAGKLREGKDAGLPRYPDAPFAAMERDARERQLYSPGRVFRAVLHNEMHLYGFEVR